MAIKNRIKRTIARTSLIGILGFGAACSKVTDSKNLVIPYPDHYEKHKTPFNNNPESEIIYEGINDFKKYEVAHKNLSKFSPQETIEEY